MLYIIKNRMSLRVKLQYIAKSIKRGFLKSESYLDDSYQREYDEITLEYLEKFHPEEYKIALERLSFIGSDSDQLRRIFGSFIYGGLKSIFLLAIVTPVILVHHVASESVYLISNISNLFVNITSKFFQSFTPPQKSQKSILLNSDANYISRVKKETRANPLNNRHVTFESLETVNNTTHKPVRSSEDERRIKGMLYSMRLMLNNGKAASIKSMQEEDVVPTLQQYRESYKSSWELPLTGSNSLILAGRVGWKL